jgi:hypothetical protein
MLGGIRRFSGSEIPIFHCAGGEETEAKGSHWGDRMLDRTLNRTLDWTRLVCLVSSSRMQQARAPVRPVKPLRNCTRGRSDMVARHVTIDRTRQVTSGCLLESIGR